MSEQQGDAYECDTDQLARMLLLRVGEPGDCTLHELVARHGAVEVAEGIVRGTSGLRAGVTMRARLPQGATTIEQAVSADLQAAERTGARLIIPGDRQWPGQLADLGARAPLGLWVLGSASPRLLALRSVSIVGARSATAYGEALARTVAATLADRGWLVVSGGAFGIDAAAHRGALDAGGASACVLAGGVDIAYPRSHEALFSRMIADGVLLSETAMGGAALRQRFLARNRLIAALTRGTVVIEAALRSGSRTTAREAANMLRPVMAFPGPVTSAMSAGCHELLRDGQAILVTCAEEIEQMLRGLTEPESVPAGAGAADSGSEGHDPDRSVGDRGSAEQRVLAALSATRGVALDRIAGQTGLAPTDILIVLGVLEAQGLATRTDRGWRGVAA